jgi:hypothetical protein
VGEPPRLEPAEAVPPGESVCGADGRTYPSAEAAKGRTRPLHGGSCGACSNPRDIGVYRRTAGSLTELARACAAAGVLFGERAAAACLELGAGLSPACNDCWAANMSCTAAQCLEPCLRRLGGPNNDELGALNECLACDERRCGPAFIRCAGVNRRRAGIESDIRRPPDQVWGP